MKTLSNSDIMVNKISVPSNRWLVIETTSTMEEVKHLSAITLTLIKNYCTP